MSIHNSLIFYRLNQTCTADIIAIVRACKLNYLEKKMCPETTFMQILPIASKQIRSH